MGRFKKNVNRYVVGVDKRQWEELKSIAGRTYRLPTHCVRKAIDEYIARQKAEGAQDNTHEQRPQVDITADDKLNDSIHCRP